MDISESSLNKPVNFYSKNTGNNIGYIREENKESFPLFEAGSEFRNRLKLKTNSIKRKRYGKRLNTVDSEFLYDETEIPENENSVHETITPDKNFLMQKNENPFIKNFKKTFDFIFSTVPLINYSYLKKKERKIKNTVKELDEINQNVDDIISASTPYGEENEIYDKLAKNLTNAAVIISKTNKKRENTKKY